MYSGSILNGTAPSGLPSDVRIAYLAYFKRFGPSTALECAKTSDCGRIGPPTRITPAQLRRSSASRTDLLCHFRSDAVRIGVTHITAALAIVGLRRGWQAPSAGHRSLGQLDAAQERGQCIRKCLQLQPHIVITEPRRARCFQQPVKCAPPPAHMGTKDQLAFGARVRNQHSSLVPAFDRWHRLHRRRDLLIVARTRDPPPARSLALTGY